MRSYVVMLPAGASTPPEPEDWRLLPEGFSKLAFLFPALWLAFHRLWLPALVAFLVPVAAAWAAGFLPADETTRTLAYTLASIAVGLFVGLEARGMAIARMARRGARSVGVIEASSRASAEDKLAVLATAGGLPDMPPFETHGGKAAPASSMPPAQPPSAPPPRRYGRARGPEIVDAPRPRPASLVPLGGR